MTRRCRGLRHEGTILAAACRDAVQRQQKLRHYGPVELREAPEMCPFRRL